MKLIIDGSSSFFISSWSVASSSASSSMLSSGEIIMEDLILGKWIDRCAYEGEIVCKYINILEPFRFDIPRFLLEKGEERLAVGSHVFLREQIFLVGLFKPVVRHQLEIVDQRVHVYVLVNEHHAGRLVVLLGNDQFSTTVRVTNHLAHVKFTVKLFQQWRFRVDDRHHVVVVLFPVFVASSIKNDVKIICIN